MWKDTVGDDWECVSASMWEMRCNIVKVMWKRRKGCGSVNGGQVSVGVHAVLEGILVVRSEGG
jgi:hypothetical protein